MVVFPNCKINLGLHILRKRQDGFHDLETIFFPVALHDALELLPGKEDTEVVFTATGRLTGAAPADNLCVKAWHLLKKDFPGLPPVRIHLHKAIPVGAGLGGGSADAAFTLRALNTIFNLKLQPEQLVTYALQLGSDCPFFILNQPCFATSRGEIMEPVAVNLSGFTLVVVNPGIHINTGWAFSQITPALPALSLKDIIQRPVSVWKELLVNDFETPVFNSYPEIADLKNRMYSNGAVYAGMSGSGSTVYGLFDSGVPMQHEVWPEGYFAGRYKL